MYGVPSEVLLPPLILALCARSLVGVNVSVGYRLELAYCAGAGFGIAACGLSVVRQDVAES